MICPYCHIDLTVGTGPKVPEIDRFEDDSLGKCRVERCPDCENVLFSGP